MYLYSMLCQYASNILPIANSKLMFFQLFYIFDDRICDIIQTHFQLHNIFVQHTFFRFEIKYNSSFFIPSRMDLLIFKKLYWLFLLFTRISLTIHFFLFINQFLHQIFIAHTMHIRHTVTH